MARQGRTVLSFLILALCLAWWVKSQDSAPCPYAKYVPDGETHTACLPPNSSCKIVKQGVNQNEQTTIVNLHNNLRSKVATGKQAGAKGFTLPQASYMRQLVWNDELAKIAQAHTNQCKIGFDCFDCRTVEAYQTGEVYYYFVFNNVNPQGPNWPRVIDNLAGGARQLKSVTAKQYTITSYTQMIWGTTRDIGCGFTRFQNGNRRPISYMDFYTCVYGPVGNYAEMDIYTPGEPCSSCSFKNTCCNSSCPATDTSPKYSGLCKIVPS